MEREVFSLEDDDYGDLFITQQSSNDQNIKSNLDKSEEEDGLFLGIETSDFKSPCLSVVSPLKNAMYSDISDAEDFEDIKKPITQDW